MSELPPDPFSHDPRFGLSANPNTCITDLPGQGGVATDLTIRATAALGEYQEYADPVEGLQLGTFTGETVRVLREDLGEAGLQPYVPPAVSEAEVAGSGVGAWFKRRFRRAGDAHQSSHYTVTIGQPEDSTVIEAVTLASGTTITARHIIGTGENPVTIELEGEELVAAAAQATLIMQEGLPLSVEAAIAERQNRPCSTITGQEAAAVARSIEAVVSPQDGSDIGSASGGQGVHNYGVISPRLDGQWSIGGATVVHRAGTVIPNVRGPKGRSVLTFLDFSPGGQTVEGQWVPGALVVCVESVYGHDTGNLINAEVSYASRISGVPNQPVEIGPAERAGLHQAIANQVDMGNMIPRHQRDS